MCKLSLLLMHALQEQEQPGGTVSSVGPATASSSSSSDSENAKKAAELARRIAEEVARRRNFAIISHPDAGKTTMVGFGVCHSQRGVLVQS